MLLHHKQVFWQIRCELNKAFCKVCVTQRRKGGLDYNILSDRLCWTKRAIGNVMDGKKQTMTVRELSDLALAMGFEVQIKVVPKKVK